MSKPRVFISHSATGDEETLALLRDLSAALQADGFSVRVDKERLELGKSWRSTINTWLGGCHAAVVLLTPKALESPYVTYEVSVLTFRQDALVFPVFLNGANDAAVRAKGLSAANIQEKHGIVAQSKSKEEREQLVERIKQGLQPVKDGARDLTPIDLQAIHIEEILKKLKTPELAQHYLSKLDPRQDTWEQEGDPFRSLAIKLLSRGIEGMPKVTPVLDEMSDHLDLKDVCDIFELMATSWVDLQAVNCVIAAARGEESLRAIAMNGDDFTVASMYVLRASGRTLKRRWRVVQSHGVIEESPAGGGARRSAEALTKNIMETLTERLGVEPPDTLAAALNSFHENDRPVFVALPAAGVDAEVLKSLREALPTVTFFFLAGTDENQEAALKKANVGYIVPPLEGAFEQDFCRAYMDKKNFLERL